MDLDPGVVSSEFEYFLKFIDRDPYALQKDMQRITGTGRLWKAQDTKEATAYYWKIAEKYNANGYLSNKEFAQMLELLRSIGYQEGVDALASSDVRQPKGWIRQS